MRNLRHAVDTLPTSLRAQHPHNWLRTLALILLLLSAIPGHSALAAGPAGRVVNINTHQTNPLPAPDDSSLPQHLLAIGNTLYFSADNGTSGRELWKSDGTPGNATLVKNINPGSAASHPDELTEFNGALVFTADDDMDRSVWVSNGSGSGTIMLAASGTFTDAADLTKSGNMLFFAAESAASGRELWKTDGTGLGTTLVANINAGTASSSPTGLTDVNGTLFFAADDASGNTELWKSNGTPGGTVKVADINPGLVGPPGSNPTELTNVNGTLFFAADDGSSGVELWKSDGTAAGTVQVKDINATFLGASSSPANLTVVGNTLFFTANDAVSGIELWKSDGTAAGTMRVKDLHTGGADSSPSHLTNVAGTLYFTANDGVSGIELWKSDGTAAGTLQVQDIYPGAPDASPSDLVAVNGTLLFTANDGVNGIELWKSKGTAQNTLLVQNIANGAGDSHPAEFAILGSSVFFQANDDTTGAELWSLPLAELNFAPIAAGTTVSTSFGTPVVGTLGATDADGDALTYSIVSNGSKGAAAITNPATGAFMYAPNGGASGIDTFTFKANDGKADSNVATVTVTIGAPNSAPIAVGASITTGFESQFSGTLAASDPEGGALSFSIVANGSKGVARITNSITGAFTYTPNAGASGADSFTFKASDGQLDSAVASVTVTIGNPKVYLPLVAK